jgi:hypothetical protein
MKFVTPAKLLLRILATNCCLRMLLGGAENIGLRAPMTPFFPEAASISIGVIVSVKEQVLK